MIGFDRVHAAAKQQLIGNDVTGRIEDRLPVDVHELGAWWRSSGHDVSVGNAVRFLTFPDGRHNLARPPVAAGTAQLCRVGADGYIMTSELQPRSAVDPTAPAPAGDRVVLRMHKDETGVIRHVDDVTTRVLGWPPEDLVGHRSLEFIHPRDHDKILGSWVRLLAAPGAEQRTRVRHSDSAGRWRWFEVVNQNLLHHPTSPVVLTEMMPLDDVAGDDSDWYTSHLLHRLTQTLPIGILEIDRDRHGVFSNARLATVLGRPDGRTVSEIFGGVAAADRDVLDRAIDTALGGEDLDVELELTHPEFGERRCSVLLRALTDRSGKQVTGAVLCVTDVTDESRSREEMKRRAALDGLTGCLNRVSIVEALASGLEQCAAGTDRCGVAVVFVDLDRFKAVNDELGHAAGDDLLRTLAERLRAATRVIDFVGRIGGDEFLLVCPGIETEAAAQDLRARVATAIAAPLDLGGHSVTPSASIGVAWTADGGVDAEDLIATADAAMYASKRSTVRHH
jgi:diguanylate cyclase (GGDEF)-like protein/PAS domain S-box-containing protein